MITRAWKLLVALLALGLVAAACGNDDDGVAAEATTEATATPEEATPTATAEATAEPEDIPTRIVSLSPTATEMLFAIGAGDQVVAVDDQSDYPEGVPTTDLSGFQPNVEAIAEYDPDLVVLASDSNDVVAGLDQLGIETLLQPAAADMDEIYVQITNLGVETGNESEAEAVVETMQADIAELVASMPEDAANLTYFHELDETLFTTTSDTFIGDVYSIAGLQNIADDGGDGSTYPQLSAEYVIETSPDLIFLADAQCCGQTPEVVSARPGWDQIAAVQTGSIVVLDEDIASRWGPRVVDFLASVVAAVTALEAPTG